MKKIEKMFYYTKENTDSVRSQQKVQDYSSQKKRVILKFTRRYKRPPQITKALSNSKIKATGITAAAELKTHQIAVAKQATFTEINMQINEKEYKKRNLITHWKTN